MRPFSKKRQSLNGRVRPIRQAMIAKAGECMLCGCNEKNPNRKLPLDCSRLTVHEICNGPMRSKALDKAFAVLVLCVHCNEVMCDKSKWSETMQLALLLVENPDDYDLPEYVQLTSPQAPNRILPEDVQPHVRLLLDR